MIAWEWNWIWVLLIGNAILGLGLLVFYLVRERVSGSDKIVRLKKRAVRKNK